MKSIYVILFFLLSQSNYLSCQNTYSVSWAPEQPSWLFPIFFEDSIGQKDTIYIGYDSRALPFPDQQDFRFGEQGFAVDTVSLQVFSGYFPPPDSAMKVIVFSEAMFYLYPDGYLFPININNVYPPITLHYDISVFYSDSISPLPYPNQTATPKAQGIISWFYGSNYIDCGYETVLITDTVVNEPINYCQKPDSFILVNFFGNNAKQDFLLYMGFAPWRGYVSLPVKEIEDSNTLSISPNPAINESNIVSELDMQSLSIVSFTGVILFEKDFQSSTRKYSLEISNFECGLYLLKVKFSDKTIIKRLIVAH